MVEDVRSTAPDRRKQYDSIVGEGREGALRRGWFLRDSRECNMEFPGQHADGLKYPLLLPRLSREGQDVRDNQ